MKCRGTSKALQRGRTECVPPRKAAFAPSPALPPQRLLPIAWPSRGGAGSARPEGSHHGNHNVATFWSRAPRRSVGHDDMPRFESCPYFRTHRVRPSEKTAFRAISGLSRMRPSCLGRSPAEGRAPHARLAGFASTRGSPH